MSVDTDEQVRCAGPHPYGPCEPGQGCNAPGPLLREDFPPLPAGCIGWVLRHKGATLYVDDRADTDWAPLLEFLNRYPLPWRIEANVKGESWDSPRS